jgi:hypothetical protein
MVYNCQQHAGMASGKGIEPLYNHSGNEPTRAQK